MLDTEANTPVPRGSRVSDSSVDIHGPLLPVHGIVSGHKVVSMLSSLDVSCCGFAVVFLAAQSSRLIL